MPGFYDPTLWQFGEQDRRVAALRSLPKVQVLMDQLAARNRALGGITVVGIDYPSEMIARRDEAIRSANGTLNEFTGVKLEIRQALRDAAADGKITPSQASGSGLEGLGQIIIAVALVLVGGFFAVAYVARRAIDWLENAPIVAARKQEIQDKSAAEITAYNVEAKRTGKFPGTLPINTYPGSGAGTLEKALDFGTLVLIVGGALVALNMIRSAKR